MEFADDDVEIGSGLVGSKFEAREALEAEEVAAVTTDEFNPLDVIAPDGGILMAWFPTLCV